MKKYKNIGFFAVILLCLLLVVSLVYKSVDDGKIKYSEVLDYFKNNQVKNFVIDGGVLKVELIEGADYKGANKFSTALYSTVLFLEQADEYIEANKESGVLEEYDVLQVKDNSIWGTILLYVILGGAVIAVTFIMTRQMQGGGRGGISFSKSRLRTGDSFKKKITFADVAGAEEEKEELSEVVEFLKNPEKYSKMGAHIPKGVLLIGPPGTGKTYMAKAVSGEAGVPFFSISGSDFVELYVGMGASRVRDTFEQAKKNAPCIIFIDEIDAVGRQRGAGLGGGHDEREQTLNQLLVEMDGFEENEGVIVMAATNRPDVLDSALLRPGRFDRQVVIGLPDVGEREAILKIHTKNKPIGEDVDLALIARTTSGFAPADLENILNEGAILAVRRKHDKIKMEDISDAILKVIVGVEKKTRRVTEKDKKLTAYHEGGHAIVARSLPDHDPVQEISIIPRGMAGGYTYYVPNDQKSYRSKNEMFNDIVSSLGGRVAEALCLDDISTGASSDIEHATSIAKQMVTKYGMSEVLGPVSFGSSEEVFLGRDFTAHNNYSEKISGIVDDEIIKIVNSAYAKAEEILKENREKLDILASLLLEKEKVGAEEFEALFTGKKNVEMVEDSAAETTEE
ncbi:MAG: ATP-dependent zinc metalloprotease FtsH [Clostridia bacterium]|nr:ATP-dependent zinc metalloprotease FtsH [Clostridia bacterium]